MTWSVSFRVSLLWKKWNEGGTRLKRTGQFRVNLAPRVSLPNREMALLAASITRDCLISPTPDSAIRLSGELFPELNPFSWAEEPPSLSRLKGMYY